MFLSSRRVLPRRRVWPLLAIALALGACKSVEIPKMPGVTPYRMVIQQGNFISDEMVAQLKPGMSKDQVRFVLGTPLVTDIFHADRWDYVFFREMPSGKREQRNLSVLFQDGKLTRVIGDILPDPNAPKPAPVAKPEPKPAAEPAPAPQAKPAPAESWEPTKQNWGSAPQAEPVKPEPAVQKEEEKKAEEKPAEEKKERGFFGRMLDRLTPGSSAEAKPAAEPETKVEAPKKEEEKKAEEPAKVEEKAAEEKKERGFFGRMLEKIGL